VEQGIGREFCDRSRVLGNDRGGDGGAELAFGLTAGRDPLVRLLILFIGVHSLALGILMLFATDYMLRITGFPGVRPIFFPSQTGIFLFIFGIFYLHTLRDFSFVKTILVSKSFAVVFLTVHAVFLSAPPIIWAACVVDGGMLVALSAALVRVRSAVAARRKPLS
jgi:hypothetical protein